MVARAFDGVFGVDEGQQAARRIARFDVRVDVLDEVVLVLLRVMFAGLVVAALHAVERLAVKRVGLAADRVAHPGGGHEVAHVARVDEDLGGEDLAGKGAEGDDPVALLGDAAGAPIELLPPQDLQAAVLDQAVDRGLGHVRLEVVHVRFAVVLPDPAVDLARHAADRLAVEDVAGGKPLQVIPPRNFVVFTSTTFEPWRFACTAAATAAAESP